MVDDVEWVGVLDPTLEHRKVYKNARIACAKNISQDFKIQTNSLEVNTKSRDEFVFEKHVNSSFDEMTKVRALCTIYTTVFREIQTIKDFATKFIVKQNWKKMLRHSDKHMAAWVLRKAMKKNVGDLERDELVEPTHSD